MTLLPTIKDFIEQNIDLIETEDWEKVLEIAKEYIPKRIGHHLRMKSLADFLLEAGFKEVKAAQYKLFDKYIRVNLRDLILDIKEGIAHPTMKFKSFISTYDPYHSYGLSEKEMVEYIFDSNIDKSCGAYIYKDSDDEWRVSYA